MATLNEVKYTALSGALARDAKLNELEVQWLRQRGRTGALNDMWKQEFAAAGFTGALGSAACGWLAAQGYLGTQNERWYQFWSAGLAPGPAIFDYDFETPEQIDDWTAAFGAASLKIIAGEATFNCGADNSLAQHNFQVEKGRSYTCTADAYRVGVTNTLQMVASDTAYGNTVIDQKTVAVSTPFSVTFVPNVNIWRVYFQAFTAAGGDIYFDNVILRLT